MKLTAIEAIRYGALENGCLNGLGDGLTVVLGPNESGKSTFTALARHVLYGYPDARKRERGYVPAGGSRHARLVFSGDGGQWAIERVDGPHRGPVSVSARQGQERTELLGEIVGGVSEQTYQVVFGFGLDELSQIESADNADIVSRLYAAGTGLAVNPLDVRKQLEQRASGLYAPRAQKPRLNTLAARMRELREQVRGLEQQASEYAADQARHRELLEQLAPLRQQRDALEAKLRGVERDAGKLSAAAEQMRSMAGRTAKLTAERDELARSIDLIRTDPALLSAIPGINAVLEETSGFSQRLTAIAEAEAQAAQIQSRIDSASGVPAGIVATPQLRSGVERWRERLAESRRDAADAEKTARERESIAEQTEQAAEQNRGASAPSRRSLYTGIGLGVLGLVGVATGIATGQWVATVLGGLVAVGGVVVALLKPPASRGGMLPDEVVRLKAEAQSKRLLSNEAAAAWQATQTEWQTWLADNGLESAGTDPLAVLELLESVGERDALAAERDRFAATAERERALAEAWVVRLVDAIRAFDASAGQIPALGQALELAARTRATVERAVSAESERRDLQKDLEAAANELRALGEQTTAAQREVAEIAARYGLEGDYEVALDELRGTMRGELDELKSAAEELGQQVARLGGELGAEGRDAAMARARQELEGVRAEAQSVADEYVVVTLAVRLLDSTRERYERERQPAVVRNAARIFSVMTDGRYTDVRAPLDGSGITVLAADGTIRPTSELSRGTAEQLYLALRVGLIGSLGEQGRWLPVFMDDVVVNFDPQRRAGAIEAVAELATMRQVLFFTCHPETADALMREVDSAALVTLDRCSL